MEGKENISSSIFTKECCQTWWGLNPQPPDHQLDMHLTEPLRPAKDWDTVVHGMELKNGELEEDWDTIIHGMNLKSGELEVG